MKFILFIILCIGLIPTAQSSETERPLGKFSVGDLNGWKEQTIGLMKSKTTYKLVKDNDRTMLVARSTKSASGQIYKLNLDPKEFSTLKWSWKIDHIIKKGDEKTKDGDDFAARVYVIFPRGFFSKTRAICYVWANRLPKGEHLASPYTPNIITVAVDSGEEYAGRLTFHQRNVYDDYRIFFGEEPPKIGGVALMTDTDNTGESAVGYYGDISLVRLTKATDNKHTDQKTKDTLPKEPKTKDQPLKGIKNNNEPVLSPQENQPAVKAPVDPKPREPNDKEQPRNTNAVPAAAPQPSSPK